MSTSFTPTIRSFGDLITPGAYRPHSRFTHAFNFLGGDSLASIVDQFVGAGPLNIGLVTIPDCEIGTLKIGTDSVIINGCSFTFNQERRYDSQITIP
ncbi:MAG: hypothetical protein QME74_01270, partial [Candidatus Edwardsbacteria bacterium]|nr:hypothetical protein [Candidatus Edwardsbacteria bacterium]